MLTRRRLLALAIPTLLSAGAIVIAAAAGEPRSTQAVQSVPSSPARLVQMQHHFLQVTLIHEAIIRGDLPSVREPALTLAHLPIPPDTPARTAPFAAAIGQAGARAAEAADLAAAASATTVMLRQCGECHRAAGVLPAPSRTLRPDVGGIVGHMLEHQRAVDELLQGLVIPSATEWRQGAERLRAAPLRPDQYPPDPRLTSELKRTDARVHQIADRAVKAADAPARAAVYSDLLTTCAQCHGLHRQIWGPDRKR
jgi:mono/diheme cytochrome c family protein